MKNLGYILRVGLVIYLCFVPLVAHGEPVPVPPLVIREIKVTGEEFVVLQATDYVPNLSEYWVGYNGSDTINPGTLVPSQQLPTYALDANDAVLLTSDGAETCDAVLVAKLSVALSDTKGTFVLRHLESTGMTSTFTTVDSVNWSKPGATGTTTDLLDLRKEAGLAYPVWYRDPSMTKPWRIGNFSTCTLSISIQAGLAAETVGWIVDATEPLAIIENINDTPSDNTSVIISNAGLAPPLITEILANPLGTGTDGTDEFIELYNSNDSPFNLSGFMLRTGITTTHTWAIPNGSVIAAKSFRAFYASETGLSMSNTSGQATLLDTAGSIVSQTDPYDSAPDGQAWALANGVWYWSTKVTPAATNIIAQPIAQPATAATKLASAKKASVKSASTAKKKTAKTTSSKTATNTTGYASTPPADRPIVHPGVLALVAALAVGYVLYEYRHDVANALHKLRRN